MPNYSASAPAKPPATSDGSKSTLPAPQATPKQSNYGNMMYSQLNNSLAMHSNLLHQLTNQMKAHLSASGAAQPDGSSSNNNQGGTSATGQP